MRTTLILFLALVALGCTSDPNQSAIEQTELGQIRGQVLDAYLETPLAGVQVRLREGEAHAVTDAEGRFVLGDVAVGTHRLVLAADGFLSGGLANVDVRAGQATEVTARLFQENPSLEMQQQWLHREEGPEPPQDREVPSEPEGRGPAPTDEVGATRAALEDPALPEMIRVWRSQGTALAPSSSNGWADRSCDGVVETLPLDEYVKGVIPHEWIPSWHPEALRAGAIAARSYASSHALGGGRWDCADVDDGTVTQVYRDDRAGPTDMAVDATSGMVVVRDGSVVRTEYSAENAHPTAGHDIDDPVCAGSTLFGHGRGACQWGTQRWATATCFREPCSYGAHGASPKDHLWMMEHYFPGTTVSTGEPPEPCVVLGPEGGVLDDSGPCFAAYGPPEYWRTESVGHDGSTHWTNAFQSDTPGNWARWSVALADAGEYRVEVNIVDAHAEYGAVRYTVRHDGTESDVIIDQRAARDGWVELGVFPFAAGQDQQVSIFDNYDVTVPADQHIVADAIRLTAPGAPPADDAGVLPPMDDAGMVIPPGDDGGALPPGHPGDGEVEGGCSTTGTDAPSGALWWVALGAALFGRRKDRM